MNSGISDEKNVGKDTEIRNREGKKTCVRRKKRSDLKKRLKGDQKQAKEQKSSKNNIFDMKKAIKFKFIPKNK